MESYKNKSKIATIISFIATFIVYIGKEGLSQIMPAEYTYLIPIIVWIATYIATQKTENTRVNVAEQKAVEEYENMLQNPKKRTGAGQFD